MLLSLETEYFNKYNPQYNILSNAFSPSAYKYAYGTIDKMKANNYEARKIRIGALNKNKKLSDVMAKGTKKNWVRRLSLDIWMKTLEKKQVKKMLKARRAWSILFSKFEKTSGFFLYNLDGQSSTMICWGQGYG